MKTMLTTLIIHIFVCGIIEAQSNYADFYKKYKDTPGVNCGEDKISTDGIQIHDSSGDSFWTFYKKFDRISYIVADSTHPSVLQEMNNNLPGKGYQSVGGIDHWVQVKFKASRSNQNEILMISSKSGSLSVVCITGSYSYDEVKANLNTINTFIDSLDIVFAED